MVKVRSKCKKCNGFRVPKPSEPWCKCCGCHGCARCLTPADSDAFPHTVCAGIRYGFADGDGGTPCTTVGNCKACKQSKSVNGYARRRGIWLRACLGDAHALLPNYLSDTAEADDFLEQLGSLAANTAAIAQDNSWPSPALTPVRGTPVEKRGRHATRNAHERGVGHGGSPSTQRNITRLNKVVTTCAVRGCHSLVLTNEIAKATKRMRGGAQRAGVCTARAHLPPGRFFEAAKFVCRQLGRIEAVVDRRVLIVEAPLDATQVQARTLSRADAERALLEALTAAIGEMPHAMSVPAVRAAGRALLAARAAALGA